MVCSKFSLSHTVSEYICIIMQNHNFSMPHHLIPWMTCISKDIHCITGVQKLESFGSNLLTLQTVVLTQYYCMIDGRRDYSRIMFCTALLCWVIKKNLKILCYPQMVTVISNGSYWAWQAMPHLLLDNMDHSYLWPAQF